VTWRNVLITSPARLRRQRSQMVISQGEEQEASVPIEDMASLILESQEVLISSSLMSSLLEAGVAIVHCGSSHHPLGLSLPFMQHSRGAEVAALQKDWRQAFIKRCWQSIIQQKIKNQAEAPNRLEEKAATRLLQISRDVTSGDSSNREAYAAQVYWPALMGSDFRRSGNDPRNAALNYGYAIVRAAIARAVAAAGLLPCFGLFHDANLNAFNLVDDLIEPFRPFVDLRVQRHWHQREEQDDRLSKEDRAFLADIVGEQFLINDGLHRLNDAAEQMAESLVRATRSKSAKDLIFPVFAL
jgi:CRISP-associated protein Cas1